MSTDLEFVVLPLNYRDETWGRTTHYATSGITARRDSNPHLPRLFSRRYAGRYTTGGITHLTGIEPAPPATCLEMTRAGVEPALLG